MDRLRSYGAAVKELGHGDDREMGRWLNNRAARGICEGDAVPDLFIPSLVELYRQGRFPFDRLVRFYDFDRINQAVEDSERGRAVKAVLRFA